MSVFWSMQTLHNLFNQKISFFFPPLAPHFPSPSFLLPFCSCNGCWPVGGRLFYKLNTAICWPRGSTRLEKGNLPSWPTTDRQTPPPNPRYWLYNPKSKFKTYFTHKWIYFFIYKQNVIISENVWSLERLVWENTHFLQFSNLRHNGAFFPVFV